MPLNVTRAAPAGCTANCALGEPSLLRRDWMSVTVPFCACCLTDQSEPLPNSNQVLRLALTASARAVCSPFITDSAAVRICEFWIQAR